MRDIAWYGPSGEEFTDENWSTEWNKSLAMLLNGQTLGIVDEDGKPVTDDSFLYLVNASADGVEFALPEPPAKTQWIQVLDTQNIDDPFQPCEYNEKVILGGRSMRIFRDGKK